MKFWKVVLPVFYLVFILYMLGTFFMREFGDWAGDPLVPLLVILVTFMFGAISNSQMNLEVKMTSVEESLQEVKTAALVFVSQARGQIELLEAFRAYESELRKSQQNPDLN